MLHDWLKVHGVTHVEMEATGDYRKPVSHVLEDDFELMLVNARHVKPRAAKRTSLTRRGCASSPRRGCCARASCRPSRSVICDR